MAAAVLSICGLSLAACADAPAAQTHALGRGVNIGNILDAPYEGAWGLRLEAELFARAREAGFDTVRLPVRWSSHAEATSPYRIDEAFFRRVDFGIAEALRHGLNIVVDMHHYKQLDGDPPDPGEAMVDEAVVDERFVAMWAQIAERYRAMSVDKVFFELYNEPHGRLAAGKWNALLRKALATVRAATPGRFVVIGPADHNRAAALSGLSLPEDDRRIIVTVHLYEPYNFTHQGAPWIAGSSDWLHTRCCSNEQRGDVVRVLELAQQWARRHDRPMWVGEFGSYEAAEYDSRVEHARLVRQEIEARGFSWAYWDLATNFGIFDFQRHAWHSAIKNALLAD
ncbi:MAG TPA: glycoside hydrolase family 5 protein [Burkholderiales bacterium]|nr:glycoside hydrolase family 5 protein [Burkholderiales bacterium]